MSAQQTSSRVATGVNRWSSLPAEGRPMTAVPPVGGRTCAATRGPRAAHHNPDNASRSVIHVRRPHRLPCPAPKGEPLIAELALAASIHLSTPATTNDRIVSAAAVSPMPEFTRCVEHRESKGVPTVVNSSGHAGLFQFSQAWRRGLPYMVAERLRDHGMSVQRARVVRITLSRKAIQAWPAVYQRIGHAEVLERGGWRHWSLPGSRCQGLVGR